MSINADLSRRVGKVSNFGGLRDYSVNQLHKLEDDINSAQIFSDLKPKHQKDIKSAESEYKEMKKMYKGMI